MAGTALPKEEAGIDGHDSARYFPVLSKTLTPPEIQALIETLLHKAKLNSNELLAFALSVNDADFHDNTAVKPRPAEGRRAAKIRQQVLAHFQSCKMGAIKKHHCFQLEMTGKAPALMSMENRLKPYRRLIGIPLKEHNLTNEPTAANTISDGSQTR